MAAPTEVLRRWSEGRTHAHHHLINYWLNYSYVRGDQWVQTDGSTGLPRRIRNQDNRIRETANKMGPNYRTIVGKFLGNALRFDVPPQGTDDQSLRGARLSQFIVSKASEEGHWETARRRQLQHLLYGGSALVVLDLVEATTDVVSGKPAPSVANLSVWPLPAFVCEPGAQSYSDARWFITHRAVPPEQVREHYNLSASPKPDSMSAQTAMSADRYKLNAELNLSSVYVMYERPTVDREGNRQNKGRIMHATGKDILVEDQWPYPFDCHPGYEFMVDDSSESWLGETFLTDARHPQDTLNYLKSQQAETARAMVPKLAVPQGFDVDQLDDDPTRPLQYDPALGGTDGIPRWISGDSGVMRMRYDVDAAAAHIDEVMHVSAISRGVGPDRASGQAIAILAEKDETPLSVIANDQRLGWSHIGTLYLKIAEKAQTSETIATVMIGRSSVSMKWSGKLLSGQTIVDVPRAATMPFSRAARNKTLIDALQAMPEAFAALSPIQKLSLFDLPELSDVGFLIDPDVEKAQRENFLMANLGEARVPQRDEDHPKHLAEHRAFRQSAAYDSLDEETQQVFLDHERAHDRFLEEEVMTQRDLNEEIPGMSAIPSSLNMIGQVGPEPQPIPAQ